MSILKKYDFSGKEIGQIEIEDSFLKTSISENAIKDYIVAICNNARQWSANTKGRSEISRTKQKSQQQKGMGKARHGMLSAPQFKGGGVVFGPKPKFDQHVKINKKQRRKVISFLLSKKIKENKIFILEAEDIEPKTKKAFEFCKNLNMEKARVLFLGKSEKNYNDLSRGIRNISRKNNMMMSSVNGYQLALCENIVVMSSCIDELKNMLQKVKDEKESV